MARNKGAAVVSYITIIGWVIGYIMYTNKRDTFTAYHIRQSLLLILGTLVLSLMSGYPLNIGNPLQPLISLLQLILVIFIIVGIIYAAQGKKKAVPILGDVAQDWFKSL